LLKTTDVYQAEEQACRQTFERCGFESQLLDHILENIRCPSCHSSLIKAKDEFDVFPSLICCSCSESLEIKDVIEEEKISYDDPEAEGSFASCNDCESTNSVVRLGEKWICFSCHAIHDEVGHCGYCYEIIAGDKEHYIFQQFNNLRSERFPQS
jgi:hypothetical protein